MQFLDVPIKINGKGKFASEKETVLVAVKQFDSAEEAIAEIGGEENLLTLVNEFYRNRAPSSFRSGIANKQKTAENWSEVVGYANEQAPSVKDYRYTGERGLSRKAKMELIDSMKAVDVENLSVEELRAKLSALLG